MYSASDVDKATHDCLRLCQLTGPPPIRNTNPEVDFLSSKSPPQSESE